MQKIRKVLVGIIATVLLTNSTTSVFAAETNEMNATILSIEENNLRQFAIDNEENIVLLDEDDYVLNEFHSDGYVAEFIYAEGYSAEHTRQLISIADNDDTIQNISYDEEGNIDELIFMSMKNTWEQKKLYLKHLRMRMLCHLLHTLHFMFHIQMEQR